MTKHRRRLDQLKPGSIRHEELAPALVARIEWLKLTLDEVYPQSMAEWLDGFQRDVNPEPEVVWWERLAHCYVEYSQQHELTSVQKQAAFRVVIKLALGSAADQISTDLADLPPSALEDILGIMQRWSQGSGSGISGPDVIQ
jgi:hypothetical protein